MQAASGEETLISRPSSRRPSSSQALSDGQLWSPGRTRETGAGALLAAALERLPMKGSADIVCKSRRLFIRLSRPSRGTAVTS